MVVYLTSSRLSACCGRREGTGERNENEEDLGVSRDTPRAWNRLGLLFDPNTPSFSPPLALCVNLLSKILDFLICSRAKVFSQLVQNCNAIL